MAKQRVKVTEEMISRSERMGLPSPYRKWVPDRDKWRIQTAEYVERVGGRDVRIEWDPHERIVPMSAAEKAEHCPDDRMREVAAERAAAVAEDQRLGRMADEWLSHMKAEQRAATETAKESWERTAAELQRRAATAVCDIETNPRPKCCSDEQEAVCEWGLAGAIGLTQAQRVNMRPDKCPRTLRQIELRREKGQSERMAVRARAAGVPELYIERFLSGDEPQRRPAFVAAQKFRDSPEAKILLLLGTNQAGKSYAASRLLWWQDSGLFVTHSALRMAIMPGDKTELERRAFGVKFLVLDNIENNMSPALRQRYEEYVIHCTDNDFRLVMTSTMDPETFMQAMKTPGAETGPAFARLTLGIGKRTVMMVECPAWGGE